MLTVNLAPRGPWPHVHRQEEPWHQQGSPLQQDDGWQTPHLEAEQHSFPVALPMKGVKWSGEVFGGYGIGLFTLRFSRHFCIRYGRKDRHAAHYLWHLFPLMRWLAGTWLQSCGRSLKFLQHDGLIATQNFTMPCHKGTFISAKKRASIMCAGIFLLLRLNRFLPGPKEDMIQKTDKLVSLEYA